MGPIMGKIDNRESNARASSPSTEIDTFLLGRRTVECRRFCS
jgi:hypothetical protein